MSTSKQAQSDPDVLPAGPITRSEEKKFREVLFLTCANIPDSIENIHTLENCVYNVLHADM